MKILLTTPTYPPFNSGLGNAVYMQALILKAAGHEVHIATGGTLTGSRLDESLGLKVHEFNITGADFLLHPIRGDVLQYQEFLKGSNFDILILNAWQTWSTDIAIRVLSKISGRKIVLSHGTSVNLVMKSDFWRSLVRYILWRPYWWRMKSVMTKIDGLIFLSRDGVDSRFDDVKLARKLSLHFSVVPNALSNSATSRLSVMPAKFTARSGFISVGSYDWAKGHDFVIRSYAKSLFKNKLPLRIFGQKFTAYTKALRSLALELDLQEDMILFYEGISGKELLDYYSSSAIFLCGSHTECQPLVLLDSMATGTPFIARATGCIPSMSGGISVSSELECAMSMNRLVSNPSDWENYSKAGFNEALSQYHPSKVQDLFLKAIHSVV